MTIETLTLGPIQANCYLLSDDQQRALVIDPGGEAPVIAQSLTTRSLKVLAYLITHGHADHVGALAEIHEQYPAPIAMHPLDIEWAFNPQTIPGAFPLLAAAPEKIERHLADGQRWTDGDWSYEVIETPGHAPGAVAFYFPDEAVLFPGDTLFQGSVGRTDLPGCSAADLTRSLQRLARLPDETRVYPGHGPMTTIGTEKQTNYFMQHGVPE